MNQREFVERYEPLWETFERSVRLMAAPGHQKRTLDIEEFPFLYRQLCQHLALARDRNYSTQLIERLNQLVLRGHQQLYRPRRPRLWRVIRFLGGDLPERVRADAPLVLTATLLLYLPALAFWAAIVLDADLAYRIFDASQLSRYEEMYDPESSHFARERDSDSDFLMFGYYIKHNISIDFQTYAGGMLFGLGSAFYLIFNGAFFGIVSAHLQNVGFGEPFFSFVVTHGAFELTAISLAGAAGLKLGLSLLVPGRRTRLTALTDAAKESITIIYGVIGLSVIAAFVEAFWSSSTFVSNPVKFAVGALCWLAVGWYFSRVGR